MAGPIYQLRTWLWLPTPQDDVFRFFADAANLERITPPFLRFRVLSDRPIVMARDTRIDYRLKLHGIPLRWQSAITVWDPPGQFCDVQIRGPYAEWIHTHEFEPQDDGTMVRDDVRYRLPGPPFLAGIVNRIMVGPDTRAIFEYRHDALRDVFKAHATARSGPVTIERLREPA